MLSPLPISLLPLSPAASRPIAPPTRFGQHYIIRPPANSNKPLKAYQDVFRTIVEEVEAQATQDLSPQFTLGRGIRCFVGIEETAPPPLKAVTFNSLERLESLLSRIDLPLLRQMNERLDTIMERLENREENIPLIKRLDIVIPDASPTGNPLTPSKKKLDDAITRICDYTKAQGLPVSKHVLKRTSTFYDLIHSERSNSAAKWAIETGEAPETEGKPYRPKTIRYYDGDGVYLPEVTSQKEPPPKLNFQRLNLRQLPPLG